MLTDADTCIEPRTSSVELAASAGGRECQQKSQSKRASAAATVAADAGDDDADGDGDVVVVYAVLQQSAAAGRHSA